MGPLPGGWEAGYRIRFHWVLAGRPGSSVGIATRYCLDGPGIESR